MTAVLKFFLLLLKWLGILLLVILGLLVVTVLLVLLAPVRYKGKLDKKEAPEEIFRADGLISWLNPFLRVRIRYGEKKLHYTVRIFGICLLNSDKPKKEKKRKEKKHSKKRKKEDNASGGTLIENDFISIKPEENPTGRSNEREEAVQAELMPEVGSQEAADAFDGQPSAEANERKPSVFAKIKQFIEKMKKLPETIKQKVTKIINTVKLLWYKKEKTIAFFEDELHKSAIGTAWDTVKKMLRHVLPGKIKGHVEFGTGDPESTGKALGAFGIIYAWYGEGITVVPDFYEKRIVAELCFKGRIRGGTLLVWMIRLLRDKNVKRFRRNFKKLQTILKQKAE